MSRAILKLTLALSLFMSGVLSVFAFDDVTKPYTFTPLSTISSSNVNASFDTLASRTNTNADTTDIKFIRFRDLESGDSTLDRLQVDTIRSNPDVDSIKGNPFIDTITTRRVVADSIIGPVRGTIVGNVTGNVTGNLTGNVTGNASGTAATVTGAAQTAITSVGTLTGLTTSGNIGTGSGDITTDSVYARTIKTSGAIIGNLTGNVTGNTSGSAATFTGSLTGDVTGTQGATVVSTVGAYSAANTAAGATLANAATSANTASAIVRRDASGNFSAGTITGNVTGNASGTAATVTGAAQTAITSVGTLTGLTTSGTRTKTGWNGEAFYEVIGDTVISSGTGHSLRLFAGSSGDTVSGDIMITGRGTSSGIYHWYKRFCVKLGNPGSVLDSATISATVGTQNDLCASAIPNGIIFMIGTLPGKFRWIFRYTVY